MRLIKVFKYKLVPLIFIMILCFTGCKTTEDTSPHAKQGIMELSQWDFNKSGNVKLDGEWEFYWNQILSPDDFNDKNNKKPELTGYIKVPGLWTDSIKDRKLSGKGCGTYRLIIKINPSESISGIKTSNIRMDSRIFVNGITEVASGEVFDETGIKKPSNTPQVSYFNVKGDSIEIIIQVINQDRKIGGIVQSIYFGDQRHISEKNLELFAEDLFLISSLIIISLIQGIKFFASRERKKYNYMTLILSINCILYAIVTSGLREKVLYQMFPWISTEFLYRIVDVSVIAYFILDLILIMKLSNKFIYTFFVKMSLAFFSFQVFLILFTPMYTYTLFQDEFFAVNTLIIFLFTIYLVVAIYKKKYDLLDKNGMRILLLCFTIPLIYAINIKLYNLSIVSRCIIADTSLILFVLVLAFLIANKNAIEYSKMKNMSERLLSLDKLKDEFLANTSHELQTPLNGIINISEALLEDSSESISNKEKQDLLIIVSISRRLSELIKDILDMTRLKRNEIKLVKTNIDIESNLKLITQIFYNMHSSKNIKMELDVDEHIPNGYADENRVS